MTTTTSKIGAHGEKKAIRSLHRLVIGLSTDVRGPHRRLLVCDSNGLSYNRNIAPSNEIIASAHRER